jgi:hypothetical protein
MAMAALPALWAATAPAQPPATNTDSDRLGFRNGDFLRGKLLEVLPGKSVRWRHPDSPEAIEFKPESVAWIEFASRAPDGRPADDSCMIWLRSGDTLPGHLVSCDKDILTLDTWYAGKLKIPRRSLQMLAWNPRSAVVFGGLTGSDGWTQGKSGRAFNGEAGQWLYRNGAFYADKAASIARDLHLPDRSQMEFDLAWKGPLNLAIALYTDSLQPIALNDKEKGPDFGGFYSLRLYSAFTTLTAIRKKEPLRQLGEPVIIQSLTQKDRTHVVLRISKAERRIALSMDGVLIKDWTDANAFVGEGTGVRFVNNIGGVVKLSHLRVAKWNGVLDESSADESDPSHDAVMLESGAKVSGAVMTIQDGRISLLTTTGATNVPLAGARAIEFASFRGPVPPAIPASVRATLAQGGAVSFDLLAWRPDGVMALSPDFGKVKFDPAAFGRLQFLSNEPAAGVRTN